MIDSHFDDALKKLALAADQRGRLQRYSRSGGTETENSWRTTGLLLVRPDDNDLVCEALLLDSRGLCVLRVYWENPLAIVHAGKCQTTSSALPKVVHAAIKAFAAQLDRLPLCTQGELEEFRESTSLPEEIREAVTLALLPVPPPLRIEDIPEAEDDGLPGRNMHEGNG